MNRAGIPHGVPDRVRVHPGLLGGELRVPGDKSLSHRALILGALCDGEVPVRGLSPGGDVAATARALRGLGIAVDLRAVDPGGQLAGTVSGKPAEPDDVLDCGNSGTTLRLLAGVAAGVEGLTVLTGDDSLRARPVDRIATPLERMGARVDARSGRRVPPLVLRGGALRGIDHTSGVASAQVKSAVLLAGLRAEGPTRVTSPLPSRDHTERLLQHLGVPVTRTILEDGSERVELGPGTPTAREVSVPGDPSAAAFWLVAAAAAGAVAARGGGGGPGGGTGGEAGRVRVQGVCLNPTRLGAVTVLRALGARVGVVAGGQRCGEPVGDLVVEPADLAGAVVSGGTVVDAIDELPLLAVAGAVSREGLEVREAAELRVKESDRIGALAGVLGAVGVRVEERADGYRVPGGQRPSGGRVHAGGDHRMAMTAAVAATVATAPVVIEGFAATATSYPTFLEDLRRLGGHAETVEAGRGTGRAAP